MLAQAIAAKREAESALDQHRAAIARAAGLVREAEARLETATADLEKARGQRVQDFAHAAAGGDAATCTLQMREVRETAIDAQADLDAARDALEATRSRLPDLEAAVGVAADRIVIARNAVLAPVAAGLLQKMRDEEAKLVVTNAVLMVIFSGRSSGWNDPLEQVSKDHTAFTNRNNQVGFHVDRQLISEAAAKWTAAVQALTADPFAPFPEE